MLIGIWGLCAHSHECNDYILGNFKLQEEEERRKEEEKSLLIVDKYVMYFC